MKIWEKVTRSVIFSFFVTCFDKVTLMRAKSLILVTWGLCLLLFGCSDIPLLDIEFDSEIENPVIGEAPSFTIRADGTEKSISSSGSTIRQVIEDADIELGLNDEVSPPLFEPAIPGSTITIVRINEEIETIERSVPFERRTVRNESM